MIDCLGELSVIEANRGEESDCRSHCDEVEAIHRQARPRQSSRRSTLMRRLGFPRARSREARRGGGSKFESCARWEEEIGVHAVPRPSRIPDLVETYVRLGRTEDARAALARLRGGASPRLSPRWSPRGAAGLVAGDDEFEGHFRRSLELHPRTTTSSGGPVRSSASASDSPRPAGASQAREQLRAALETFARLGATPWGKRVRAASWPATGERLRRRHAHEAEELTPQELQIALQVAEGKSNKDVGAALFLSHKTVEFHLGRIIRKLDIHSRGELIRRFAAETAFPAAS